MVRAMEAIGKFQSVSSQSPQRIKLRNLVIAIIKNPKNFSQLIKATCKLIPEFAQLSRPQNSSYHRYNIDIHTFELISRLLDDPAVKPAILEELVLAALLHDIGKPASELIANGESTYVEHPKFGTQMAQRILSDLGITDEKSRQIIQDLVWLHMRPLQMINQAAKGNLPDNALKNFIKDVLVPLEQLGVDLDTILAFGRADIIACQGPQSYAILGVTENTESAYIAKTDEMVKAVKAQIIVYRESQRVAQEKAAALKSCPVNGNVLKDAGYKPGPQFGQALKTAVELAAQGLSKEAILARLKELYPIG
jgi:hypothetical protein